MLKHFYNRLSDALLTLCENRLLFLVVVLIDSKLPMDWWLIWLPANLVFDITLGFLLAFNCDRPITIPTFILCCGSYQLETFHRSAQWRAWRRASPPSPPWPPPCWVGSCRRQGHEGQACWLSWQRCLVPRRPDGRRITDGESYMKEMSSVVIHEEGGH